MNCVANASNRMENITYDIKKIAENEHVFLATGSECLISCTRGERKTREREKKKKQNNL